jgi:crotonobetainyl-CoA:carnitine CoA-transferase CaiB-like acyl-CoA transferase
VRTSLLAGVVGAHAFQGTRWTIAGQVPGLSGAHHPAIAPYGLFRTGTAPIQVCVGSERIWHRFALVVGFDADDPGLRTNRERVAHRDSLTERIETVFTAEPADHWLPLLDAAGVPAGKVRSLDDVYDWEQTRSQGLLLEVDHPAYGRVVLPGSPLRFDDQPFSGGLVEHRPPPMLDEHGASIRDWLDG